MASLSEVLRSSDIRIQGEVQNTFTRRGLENALLLAVNPLGQVERWAADVNGVTLPVFAAFTNDDVVAVRVWAWRPGNNFDLVQEYRVTRLGPPVPAPMRPVVIDPLPPPPPSAFQPRLPTLVGA